MNSDEQLRELGIKEWVDLKNSQNNFQTWLLNDETEIRTLQFALMGFRKIEGEWYHYPDEALMNSRGARILTETFLLPIIKNSKLTYLEKSEINEQMEDLMIEILDHIKLNSEKYDLKFENEGIVLGMFETYLLTVFNRSLRGLEHDRLTTTQKIISKEHFSGNQEQSQSPYGYDQIQMNQGKKWWNPF